MTKLLTLNLHGLTGATQDPRFSQLLEFIRRHLPTAIAFQEACQSSAAPALSESEANIIISTRVDDVAYAAVPVKSDNIIYRLIKELSALGIQYYGAWLPIKQGYGVFDEGIAMLSSKKPLSAHGIYLSETKSYFDWRTRMALTFTLPPPSPAVVCVHMGRYDDTREPFSHQWNILKGELSEHKKAYVLGDFNAPSEIRGEGYDLMLRDGMYDLCTVSGKRAEPTVRSDIDGWRDHSSDMRIDLILSSFIPEGEVTAYRTVFDGRDGAKISDHLGVFAELQDPKHKEEQKPK